VTHTLELAMAAGAQPGPPLIAAAVAGTSDVSAGGLVDCSFEVDSTVMARPPSEPLV
jgi:hypothetical protein